MRARMSAIGSSDADFAPLAVRLREDGIRVLCFALRDKADSEALALVYDEVIYLDGAMRAERPAPAPRPAIFGTQQPQLMSIHAGCAASATCAASARRPGSEP